ncbi:hypothetical protein DD557_02430 [Thalassobacter stenotrophicus]|nr:hypothetical protein DD557_02430 [Thalassobacter stenotrophicus]
MRHSLIVATFAMFCLTGPVVAFAVQLPLATTASTPEHGGGCRKDSPSGQCCHAGSKPYHCH